MSRASATFALVLFYAGSAPAQLPCSLRADAIAQLAEKYGETPMGFGLAQGGHVVELLTSDTGGTWTIVVTLPNGMSCLVAAGENWESLQAHPHQKLPEGTEG